MKVIFQLFFRMYILPLFGVFTNSTAVITDMGTVITNITSTQQARAIAAGGPILDVNAICEIIQLRFQEAKVLCNYLLYGNQIASGSQGGASSIIASGDGTIFTTLVNVYNDLG